MNNKNLTLAGAHEIAWKLLPLAAIVLTKLMFLNKMQRAVCWMSDAIVTLRS